MWKKDTSYLNSLEIASDEEGGACNNGWVGGWKQQSEHWSLIFGGQDPYYPHAQLPAMGLGSGECEASSKLRLKIDKINCKYCPSLSLEDASFQ